MQRYSTTIVAGVAAGMLVGLLAAYLGTWLGMHELGDELTARHVIGACIVVNVVGAAGYHVLARRFARPELPYLAIALGLAVLASAKLRVWPPATDIVHVADALHVFVAVASTLALRLFAGGRGGAPVGAGRILLTLVAIGGPLSSLVMDFDESHVYNAAWSPHARYHGFMFMNLLVAVGLLALAMLWRPARPGEARLRITIAAYLDAAVALGFLLPLVVPDASSWPDGFEQKMAVNGNVVMAMLMLVLTAVGTWLALRSPKHERRTAKGLVAAHRPTM